LKNTAKRFLLVGGLGHTDLSGKVPRPGLLMLRKALQRAGHEAEVLNYALSLGPRMFPPDLVADLSKKYYRSIKPVVIDGARPTKTPLPYVLLPLDMRGLIHKTRWIQENEVLVLKQLGHEISEKVKKNNIDAVGFSLYLGSSTIGSILIANILRTEHPDLPIFFGGPQTTHFADTIYRETTAPTALVLGEGEVAIVKLANALPDLRNGHLNVLSQIPNLVYRTHDGEIKTTQRERMSLEEWIESSRAFYTNEDFDGVFRYAFIEASRGCIYGCRFCPQPMLSGRERYLKTGEQIVDEMESIFDRFGIHHFELVGSSTPPGQAEAIADALDQRGLKNRFKWGLFMRGRDETATKKDLPSLMRQLHNTGAHAIFFGVEAASNQTLEKMGKGERLEEIRAAMIAAKKEGIITIGSFIYPYPGMLPDEGQRIVNFIKDVRPDSAPAQPLGLYPGTHCANFAEEIGVEILYPEKKDQQAYLQGRKDAPTMESPEVLSYLLKYPLILSLPMRFWPPLPWKIDGQSYKQTVKAVTLLQKEMGKLGIMTGLSHSHALIAGVLGWQLPEIAERLFYCSITGDPEETEKIVNLFNERASKLV
jgi:radical SAM superfamily enzyme YgiQ (UPF0313 family)